MSPETRDANEIRIYKCKEFPLKWEYEKTIFKNIKATDPMIFNFNNFWWLITTFQTVDMETKVNYKFFTLRMAH